MQALLPGLRPPDSKGIFTLLAKVARGKLVQVNNAIVLSDLAIPWRARLDALKGDGLEIFWHHSRILGGNAGAL